MLARRPDGGATSTRDREPAVQGTRRGMDAIRRHRRHLWETTDVLLRRSCACRRTAGRRAYRQVDRTEQVRAGREGRIVVRISGTEPLIRVMVEGQDDQQIYAVAGRVADIVRERLGN